MLPCQQVAEDAAGSEVAGVVGVAAEVAADMSRRAPRSTSSVSGNVFLTQTNETAAMHVIPTETMELHRPQEG